MVYSILEFAEESGCGSSASVNVVVFSTEEKRADFIDDWVFDHKLRGNTGSDGPNEIKFFDGMGWVYWLELSELDLDCVYSRGRLVRRY